MQPILRIDNLWKSYSAGVRGCSLRVWALRGCSLHLQLGERIAIVGSPGAGKSTLIRCIYGDLRPDAGHVDLLVPLVRHDASERREDLQLRWPLTPSLRIIDDEAFSSTPLSLGTTAIITSRDVARIRGSVDRILLLRDGRLTSLTHVAIRRVAEPTPPRLALPSDTHESSSPEIVRQ